MSSVPGKIVWQNRALGEPYSVRYQAARLWRPYQPAAWSEANPPRRDGVEDSDEAKMARLLAVLFLAKEPFASRRLSQYSNLADGTEARTLVARLNRRFDSDGRAIRIESVAGGYQLVTRPKFAKWLRRLDHVPGEVRLSAPAMETLAVVAYRQPVLRAEVEAIRGVSCGEILSQLLSRDLIRIGGRSDELGRPYLYNTTKRFMQVFGIRSLDELPRAELFSSAPIDSVRTVDETTTSLKTSEKGPSEEN